MSPTTSHQDPITPIIHTCFEPVTGTWQYIVADPITKHAAIIDSVLDFDPATSLLKTTSADHILTLISQNNLTITHIMETHAHADHLTASRYLQQKLLKTSHQPQVRPIICIGKRITQVQSTFAKKYNIPPSELENVFDHLWEDNEVFSIGDLKGEVLYLPGHTPDHVGYKIEENVFTGDSIFNPDVGSARADFPGGSATDLYRSVQTLLGLPGEVRLYTGHDYPPATREGGGEMGKGKERAYTTVEEQRRENKHVKEGTEMSEFVKWRSERDAQLGEPRLLAWAMQVNVRGGRLPRALEGGERFFSVPVKGAGDVLEVMAGYYG